MMSMNIRKGNRILRHATALVLSLAIFLPATVTADQFAVITTSDRPTGAHSVVAVDPVGGSRAASNNLAPSGSDLTVVAYGQYFYRMERSSAHNITKYDIEAPDTAIWQFSTGANSNPYDLIFVNEQKAYLLRYGSDTAWIVNPSVAKDQESEFKIDELDLSAYAEATATPDGIPEMTSGVLVGDSLYITLQKVDRNDGWTPTSTSTVLVVDVTTDAVIDEIDLPVPNPQTLQYLPDDNTLYIACIGGYFDPASNGGLVSIELTDPLPAAGSLLIDGDAYSGISGLVMASSTKGYFIGYGSWESNTLYSFDPTNLGSAPVKVAGFEGLSLGGMQNSVSLDKNNMLWICNQTDARIDILDTSDDTVDESVSTILKPTKVAFASAAVDVILPPDGGDDDDLFNCFINTLR